MNAVFNREQLVEDIRRAIRTRYCLHMGYDGRNFTDKLEDTFTAVAVEAAKAVEALAISHNLAPRCTNGHEISATNASWDSLGRIRCKGCGSLRVIDSGPPVEGVE